MKVAFRLLLPLVLVLISEVSGQRRKPPRKPTRPPPEFVEPVEPTELPPPLPPGPPSVFPDCPRECYCPPDFPSALYCDSRNLRKVPIIPSRIHYLYLQNNFIDDLPEESFRNATGLKWVNLDNNRIRKVDRRVLEKLENLIFLYMEKNQLKEVPSFLPPNLEQLRLSRNQISKIPAGVFNKLENLVLLDLHHNKLSDGVFNKNTFKGLKNLMQLNLAHNILRKMPPGVPNAIHQLFLDRNNIEDIPSDYFKEFPNLAFIRLNYNQISDKGLPKNSFNLTNLLVLHLAHNKLTNVPFISPKLEHLYLNNNSIESENQRDADLPHLADVHPGLLPLRPGQRAPAPVPAAGWESPETPHPLGPDDVFPPPAVRGFLTLPRSVPLPGLGFAQRLDPRQCLTRGTLFASLSPCSHPASIPLAFPPFLPCSGRGHAWRVHPWGPLPAGQHRLAAAVPARSISPGGLPRSPQFPARGLCLLCPPAGQPWSRLCSLPFHPAEFREVGFGPSQKSVSGWS
ncbi:prolargin isoform X1 [Aquila chrysaetos chrysaetos]|uniref:prolargin isoform X1 n=1 Tax=Aquila chrysaetos chrysaetos TaxID=223781 RepID=UPI001176AA3A|nr:prolargin isoform X1 [Aquila chrysaetos chrysaetos]